MYHSNITGKNHPYPDYIVSDDSKAGKRKVKGKGRPPVCLSPQHCEVALSYICYDDYLLLSPEENFKDEAISLDEYLRVWPAVASPPFTANDGNLSLPGDISLRNYRIPTDAGRKITRTLLKGLWKNEQRGECFGDFDQSNIFVTPSGKVKFKGVQRLKLCEINKLRQNYLSAHQIVSDLFSKGGKIPEDIDHLLNMIKFKFEKRDLYHIHASLVPIANMTLLLKLMYDHLKFAIRDTVRYTILLQLPYVTDWPTRIVLNMLLMHSYNFIRGLYEVPPDEPGQTELNEKQISALKMLGLAVVPGQRSLTQFQQRVIKASKFMDFLRNRTSHRMDALNVFASYSPEGSELSSYVCYPLILPHLQDALYDANELSKLDMKSLF